MSGAEPASHGRRLIARLLLLVAVVALLDGARLWWPRTVDDAYIIFHYSQNLADGLGAVFNPGERVEGYSSPSWMLTMSATIAAGIDPVVAAKWLGLACAVLLLLVTHRAIRRQGVGPLGASLTTLLLGSSFVLQIWSVSGLETVLYALLLFCGLVAASLDEETGRASLACSALLAAAALTRPEGVAFWLAGLGVAVAWPGARRRSRSTPPTRAWTFAIPGLALVAHFAWRAAYYGELLPNTYFAKTGGGLPLLRQGLQGLEIFLAEPAHWIWLAAAVLGAAAGWSRPALRRGTLIMAAAVTLHLAYVVSVGDDGLRVYRFYVPILAPLAYLVGMLFFTPLAGRRVGRALATVGVLAVVAAAAASSRSLRVDLVPRSLPGALLYQEGNEKLGRHLGRTLPAGSRIAVAAAGAVPFYSRLPAIDMFGLNDREIARRPFPAVKRGRLMKWDSDSVLSREPALIVLNRGYFRAGDPHADEVANRPGLLVATEMDRDLMQRLGGDARYAPRVIRFEDGSRFFVFARRATDRSVLDQ